MTDNTMPTSDRECVLADSDAIYLGNIYTVETSLELPMKGEAGSRIKWNSGNPEVINDGGVVTRPENGQGNVVVPLTATITKGEAKTIRRFDVTVLEKERISPVVELKTARVGIATGESPSLPGVVITVRGNGTYGVAGVKWEQADPVDCNREGSFELSGKAEGTDLRARALIRVIAGSRRDKPVRPAPKVRDFPMHDVALTDNLLSANHERGLNYLRAVDDDQMLYNFRKAAGLDTCGAEPMTGWDAPEGNLRGHTTGHYLSAIALAYAGTQDIAFKAKIDYMIAELGRCQDAMEDSGNFGPGFLSAYSEEQFIKLESFTVYPKIWAPYYTLHKIMAGLLDCHLLAGNEQALEICARLGHWVHDRLSRLSSEHRNHMWAMYIAGEFGGMNETMTALHTLTGEEKFMETAKYFENDNLFVPMAENYDTLGGMHANQHIPQIVGALKMYVACGERYYYELSQNFWNMVVNSHIYNIGGTGEGEMFRPANVIARYISNKTAESCATYNMLKLSRDLFMHNPDAKYMDYCERALYNHMIATQDPSGPVGGSTYFMPLGPGMRKQYDTDGNSCCHGTGMESHVKYQQSIYFQTPDSSALYVNLYIPSVLWWEEKEMHISLSGDFLAQQSIKLTVNGGGPAEIRLRVPRWAKEGFGVSINGVPEVVDVRPGEYLSLNREWTPGDEVDISVPFNLRTEPTADDPDIGSLLYGPLVLVAESERDAYIELPRDADSLARTLQRTDGALAFRMEDNTRLIPSYAASAIPYHAYYKLV